LQALLEDGQSQPYDLTAFSPLYGGLDSVK